MFYLEPAEIKMLLQYAYERNRLNHLAILTTLVHALRIGELRALTVDDIWNGELYVRAEKGGSIQISPLHKSADPLFDEMPLSTHAFGIREAGQRSLFPLSRQRYDQIIREYCAECFINPKKAHWHVLRHSAAWLIWSKSLSLGAVKQGLRHRSWSASLVYLAEADNQKSVQSMAQALQSLSTGA